MLEITEVHYLGILVSTLESLSINGFDIMYSFSDLTITVNYDGKPLQQLIKLPRVEVNPYEPLNSITVWETSQLELSNKVFDTMEVLYNQGKPCLAALFGSHFYEFVGVLNDQFVRNGLHVLSVPFWLSVIDLVKNWEKKHSGISIHIGTPLYFLSEAYLMMQNNDMAFCISNKIN